MSSETADRTLGDVVILLRGTTYKSALLGQPGPVLLGLASMQRDGGFRGDSLKTYGGPSADKLLLHPGDIYISLKDVTQSGDLLGAVARVPVSVLEGRLTQDTVKLEVIEESVPNDYLYWLLRTPQYRAYCRSHAIGTTNLSLSRRDFLDFPVPTPSSRQLSFTETLQALDDKIEANRRISETLEEITRTLFKSWFVDFDPVRGTATVPEDIRRLFPDRLVDSPIGLIPEGWEVRPIGDLVRAVGGATPSTSNPAYWDGEIPFVTPRDMSTLSAPVIASAARRITPTGLERISSGLLEPGTVVMSSRAPIGYLAISEVAIAVNQGIIAFPPERDALPAVFIFHWLASHMSEIVGNANGTTFLEISKKNFRPIPCVKPPSDIVSRFERLAAPMHANIAACDRESQTLAELRDTLLPKLISGEVRLKAS